MLRSFAATLVTAIPLIFLGCGSDKDKEGAGENDNRQRQPSGYDVTSVIDRALDYVMEPDKRICKSRAEEEEKSPETSSILNSSQNYCRCLADRLSSSVYSDSGIRFLVRDELLQNYGNSEEYVNYSEVEINQLFDTLQIIKAKLSMIKNDKTPEIKDGKVVRWIEPCN